MNPTTCGDGGQSPPPGESRRDASQADKPPPNPLQSSTATYKDIGTIRMSDTQNMMTVGNQNTVNYIINAHRGDRENISTSSSAQYQDVRDITTTARADHEIYSSQLLTKKRGFPLWAPGPALQLPIEYRRQGINIGDVGIITSLGSFDFLFNIFKPFDDPINRRRVPRGFSPLSLELLFDIQRETVYGSKTYLASSSVRMISMNRISESAIVQKFESTENEAAILIMPDGATTQDLLGTQAVCEAISSNARNWYHYARVTRGRRVKSGDIRVVVGVDKVPSWGIATSACHSGQTASYEFRHDPTDTYAWDCTGGSGRVGPQKSDIRDLMEDDTAPQNQCVFVRTINFTISGEMWNNFPSEAVEELDPGSDSFDYQNSPSSNQEGPSEGHGSSGSGSTSGHQPGSTQQRSLLWSVNFDPVELGVAHPSAALHNCLHEKFPDATMVITQDMNWISVLNDDDVVFPEPDDLCARVLKTHDLQNNSSTIFLVRKDDSHVQPSRSSTSTPLPFPNDPAKSPFPSPALVQPPTLETVSNPENRYFDQERLADTDRMRDGALAKYETKLGPQHISTPDSVPSQQDNYSNWSVESNPEIRQCLNLHVADTFTFPERVFCAKFSRDGKYLAVGLKNGETHIFNMMLGSRRSISYHETLKTFSDIWSVQFSPNNHFIATGGSKGQINIWDIYQRRLRATFKHTDLVRSVDISPDGRFLVSASYDQSLRMWNIRDGSRRLWDGSANLMSVRFSPDGQYVAAGNYHGSLSIWRVRNGRLLANYRIKGSGLDLRSVTFTPDGKRIASGGNMVHLWDASSLTDMIKADSRIELNRIWEFDGNKGFITAVSFSSDNRWVVTSSNDHNAYILDARSGGLVCTLKGHLQRVWVADFSPAGHYLITGGRDHLLRLWKYEVVE